MKTPKDMYKHLDNDQRNNFTISLNMEQLAEHVCMCNYGLHRFLSKIVDIQREYPFNNLEWASKLEKLVEEMYQ